MVNVLRSSCTSTKNNTKVAHYNESIDANYFDCLPIDDKFQFLNRNKNLIYLCGTNIEDLGVMNK